jgi:hypothetical protein
MKGIGNLGDILRLEIPQNAILHVAEIPRVDEQHLAGAVGFSRTPSPSPRGPEGYPHFLLDTRRIRH